MAKKSYILTANFEAPFVRITGIPHDPQQIRFKKFKRGDIVQGELKHNDNKPAFVLVEGTLPIPVWALKELISKNIGAETSNASGSGEQKTSTKEDISKIIQTTDKKAQFLDVLLLGAGVGAGLTYLAEKKAWIPEASLNNKLIGAAVGAGVFAYVLWRVRRSVENSNKSKQKE